MKINKQILFILLSVSILIASCETEKRLYMPGVYSEWHLKKNKKNAKITNPIIENKTQIPSTVGNNLSACSESNNELILIEHDINNTIDDESIINERMINSNSSKSMEKNKIKMINSESKISDKMETNKKLSTSYKDLTRTFKYVGFFWIVFGLIVMLLLPGLGSVLGFFMVLYGILNLVAGRKKNKAHK